MADVNESVNAPNIHNLLLKYLDVKSCELYKNLALSFL